MCSTARPADALSRYINWLLLLWGYCHLPIFALVYPWKVCVSFCKTLGALLTYLVLMGVGRHGGWAECKRRGQRAAFGTTVVSMASSIQFIKGIKEPSVPDVKLTRARDGSSGTAQFTFNQPSVFEASSELGDITGLYLVDDEGTLQTVDVQAKFVNGKPDRIEAKYVMRSSFEWDR